MHVFVSLEKFNVFSYFPADTGDFDDQPMSKNISTNQHVNFTCLPSQKPWFVAWIVCSQSALNGLYNCTNAHQLGNPVCQTIVKPKEFDLLNRTYYYLNIFIKDNCLLNELNNSFIYCQALYNGSARLNSSQARLLVQGQLYTLQCIYGHAYVFMWLYQVRLAFINF